MDIVTQGLAGAVLAQSFSKGKETRIALAVGFLAGLLADIDALFTRSEVDPLLQLDFHRHFTHSLFFIPFGGLIAAILLWPVMRRYLPFRRMLLFTTAGYATSGIIDACTSYGTSLLWPLSDARISWSIISILDPLFSLALIAAIVFAAVKQAPRYAMFGICFALSYLLLGFAQHQRVEAMAMALAESRGHQVERLEVKPTMGNLLLWRSIYEAGGRFYIDAFRASFIGEERLYPGESVKRFELTDLPQISELSMMAQDIRRFDTFSDGYIALSPGTELLIGDIRYSMLPNAVRPIWGIRIDLAEQERHTPFHQHYDTSEQTRQMFIDMLFGKDV
ncbi:MAG: metal-dependent hydrolase, partial [Mariprofundaceae bacterium]|nr:metal-dependent hydrolase [Mariprofundaceae bacterium]